MVAVQQDELPGDIGDLSSFRSEGQLRYAGGTCTRLSMSKGMQPRRARLGYKCIIKNLNIHVMRHEASSAFLFPVLIYKESQKAMPVRALFLR